MVVRNWIAVALVLLIAAPAASADVTDPPPEAVKAKVQASGAINVTWLPPAEASVSVEMYHVYRDGVQVTTTTDTWFVDVPPQGIHAYFVTAQVNGEESAPSEPVLVKNSQTPIPAVWQRLSDPNDLVSTDLPGLGCGGFIGLFDQPDPPFFSYGIRWRCLPEPLDKPPIVGIL